MRALPRAELLGHLLVAVTVFGGLSALVVVNPRIANEWIPLNLIAAAGYVALRMRRYLRRLRSDSPLQPGIRDAVLAMPHVTRLSLQERERLLQQVQWFLQEQRISGVGAEVDDTLRASVGVGAALLSLHLPHFEWPTTREILIYADSFNDGEFRAREDGELDGQFHAQGPILFSARELREAFADEDGSNVALHEFAHAIDFAGGAETDGSPDLLDAAAVRDWRATMARHLRSIGTNRRLYRLLDSYAYSNEAEFFAAVTEHFFELPDVLDEVAPEIYALCRRLYRQDPLARIPEQERTNYAAVMGRTTRSANVQAIAPEGDKPAVELPALLAAASAKSRPSDDRDEAAPAQGHESAESVQVPAPDGLEADTGGQLLIPGVARRRG